ncbi:MAG: NUDIX domain-containing protein [Rhodospirillales bacterium]|nr:NUDIX domain-containing protein [Rhodospirillales bacterium]
MPPSRQATRRVVRRTLTAKDVRVFNKGSPFKGYFRIDRYRLNHRLFEGGWSAPMTREVFERGHAVGVLLYDPDSDVVVLIEQFRIGAYAVLPSLRFRRSVSPWLMEIVAGIVEKGESAADVARRESIEEAGCEIRDLIHICDYMVSPGGSTETVILFCGRVRAPRHGSIHGIDAEHEDIRVHAVPSARALAWLDSGVACNSMIVIALQWFRLNRDQLRKRWKTRSQPRPRGRKRK